MGTIDIVVVNPTLGEALLVGAGVFVACVALAVAGWALARLAPRATDPRAVPPIPPVPPVPAVPSLPTLADARRELRALDATRRVRPDGLRDPVIILRSERIHHER